MSANESTLTDLRPLTMGEVFDVAFDLYKQNFALICVSAAIVAVPFNIATDMLLLTTQQGALYSNDTWVRAHLGEVMIQLGLIMGLAVIFSYILQGAVVTTVTSHRLLGYPIRTGQAYRQLLPRLIPLGVTWFVAGGAITVLLVIIFTVWMFGTALIVGLTAAGAAATTPNQTAAIVVAVLVVIGVIILAVAWIAAGIWLGGFLTPIIMVERTGYIQAILRNVRLVRSRFLLLCGAGFLVVVIVTGLDGTLTWSVTGLLEQFVYTWIPVPPIAQHMVEAIWSAVSSLLVQPYLFVCLTVLYYDQRVRTEGLDLELLQRRLEGPVPVETPA